MKKIFLNILQFLLFLSIGSVILFFVYRSQNETHKNNCCAENIPQWESVESEEERQSLLAACRESGLPEEKCIPLMEKLINDFKRVKYSWIFMVMMAFVVSNISRTYKWKMLLKPMNYHPRFANGFMSILVGYFANLALPRIGEVVRAGVLSKYERIPAEKVMGTIVVDRIVDVICLGIVFGVALFFESEKILGYIAENSADDTGASKGLDWKMILLGLMVVSGLLLLAFRKRLMATSFYKKVTGIIQGFWEGIRTVRRLETPWLFVFHSLNIWVMFFVMTWFGFKAFGPTEHLGLQAALTVFVFGTLGFIIPSPGGLGTFQLLVTACLTSFYAIADNDAFSASNIIFFCVQIGFNSLLGILALIILPVFNREYVPPESHRS